MGTTLGELKARIADELDRSDLSNQISAAIQSAIQFYEGERFFFNEAMATLNTTSGTMEYLLPSDFQQLDTLTVTDGTAKWLLNDRPFAFVVAEESDTTDTGKPDSYAIYAGHLRLFPTPDGVYTMTAAYQKKLPQITDDAGGNAWYTEGEEMIRTRAKIAVLEEVIRGEEAIQYAQVLRLREKEAFDALRLETTRRKVVSSIVPLRF